MAGPSLRFRTDKSNTYNRRSATFKPLHKIFTRAALCDKQSKISKWLEDALISWVSLTVCAVSCFRLAWCDTVWEINISWKYLRIKNNNTAQNSATSCENDNGNFMNTWSGNAWIFTEPRVLCQLPCCLPLIILYPSTRRLTGGSVLSRSIIGTLHYQVSNSKFK